MRLPRDLPVAAVRRVVCQECHQPYTADQVLDVGVIGDLAGNHAWTPAAPPAGPGPAPSYSATVPAEGGFAQGRLWKVLSVPIAAAAVVGGLLLIQGSSEPAHDSASSGTPAAPSSPAGDRNSAHVVKGSSFTVALPPGWKRTSPQGGATFAAAPADGTADATLWIEKAPNLSFHDFERRSLDQLRGLAGTAHVVDRVAAPTAEGTVVTLAADNPPGQPAYEVTLRVAGPYRYYLATSVDPQSSREAADGADLIHNSFVPTAAKGANSQ